MGVAPPRRVVYGPDSHRSVRRLAFCVPHCRLGRCSTHTSCSPAIVGKCLRRSQFAQVGRGGAIDSVGLALLLPSLAATARSAGGDVLTEDGNAKRAIASLFHPAGTTSVLLSVMAEASTCRSAQGSGATRPCGEKLQTIVRETAGPGRARCRTLRGTERESGTEKRLELPNELRRRQARPSARGR